MTCGRPADPTGPTVGWLTWSSPAHPAGARVPAVASHAAGGRRRAPRARPVAGPGRDRRRPPRCRRFAPGTPRPCAALVEALEKAAEDQHVAGPGAAPRSRGSRPSPSPASCAPRCSACAGPGKPTVAWSESYGETGPGNTALPPGQRLRGGLAAAVRRPRASPAPPRGRSSSARRSTSSASSRSCPSATSTRAPPTPSSPRRCPSPTARCSPRSSSRRATTLVQDVAAVPRAEPSAGPRRHRRGAADRGAGARGRAGRPARLPRRGVRRRASRGRTADRHQPIGAGAVLRRPLRRPRRRSGHPWSRRPRGLLGGGRPTWPSSRRPAGSCLGHSGASPLGGRSVGSDTLGWALRAAGRDESVRAVVLRVESPGGSYVASDTLRREVHALRETGTTVVASMGGVAGSGRLLRRDAVRAVVATPGTLTGSIGVLAGKQVLHDALDRVGVRRDSVSVGRFAQMFSDRPPFDEEEWAPAGVVAGHGLRRLHHQGGRRPRRCRSRTSSASPGAASGPGPTPSGSVWSTSSAASPTPSGSPAGWPGSTVTRWPSAATRGSARSTGWARRATPSHPPPPASVAGRPAGCSIGSSAPGSAAAASARIGRGWRVWSPAAGGGRPPGVRRADHARRHQPVLRPGGGAVGWSRASPGVGGVRRPGRPRLRCGTGPRDR